MTCVYKTLSGYVAEMIPFSAAPLYGPEAGGTVITISYSFWASGVMTSDDFANNVSVALNDLQLTYTVM